MRICKYTHDTGLKYKSDIIVAGCFHWFTIFRSEYGAFWKCIQGGIIYAFTQLCKMLILATFFPANEASISILSLSVGIGK